MKRLYVLLVMGVVMVGVGLGFGVKPFLQYWRDRHLARVASPFTAAASAAPVPKDVALITGRPIRVEISSLKIDLPVIDGTFNPATNTWTLTKDKVQYATNTPQPNNLTGNTFLYGHNRPGVFNTLNKIKPGAEISITTDNGHRFTYAFRGAVETDPNDDSLFRYQGPPILTVQTCSGAWYQNRQLFTFALERVETI
jgi:sortase (surface protein transpeptidase)